MLLHHSHHFAQIAFLDVGTHFAWEVMTMLLRNSCDYIKEPKECCMMDLFPLSETEKFYSRGTPKVLNTHFRLDVLPKEFQNRKTVLGEIYYLAFFNIYSSLTTH